MPYDQLQGGTFSSVVDPYWKLRQLERFGKAAQEVALGIDRRRTRKAMDALDRVRKGELEWDAAEVHNAINKVRDAETLDYLRKSLRSIRDNELPEYQALELVEKAHGAMKAQMNLARATESLPLHLGGSALGPATEPMLMRMFSDPQSQFEVAARMYRGEGGPAEAYRIMAARYPEVGKARDEVLVQQERTAGAAERGDVSVAVHERKQEITTRETNERASARRDPKYLTLIQGFKDIGYDDDKAEELAFTAYRQVVNLNPTAEDLRRMGQTDRQITLGERRVAVQERNSGGGGGGTTRKREALPKGLPAKVGTKVAAVAKDNKWSASQKTECRNAALGRIRELMEERGFSKAEATEHVLTEIAVRYGE